MQSITTLDYIVQRRLHEAAHTVDVDVNDLQEWVTISDPAGEQEDIFMEGHSAEEFAAEVLDVLDRLTPDTKLSRHDCAVFRALSYAENHWN